MRKDDRESRHRHPRRILDGAEELGHRARAEIATVKHREMNITLFVTGNEKRLVSCDTRRLGFVSTGLYLIAEKGRSGSCAATAGWNHDLLSDHFANLDLDFLLDTDGNADRVGLGLVFVHGVADGDLVLLFTRLGNANGEVHDPRLLFRNNLADRHLASAVFLTAELDLVFVLLLRSNHLSDLDGA